MVSFAVVRGVHADALVGPHSVTARVLGHPAVLLGGPRALLLQLAHPSVAAGVADHSSFAVDPYARLVRTLSLMHEIAFGPPESARRTAMRLSLRHDQVRGKRPDGIAYSASDPALLLWVHGTLVQTMLAVERRYMGELIDREQRQLYEESRSIASFLGIPIEIVPPDLRSFEQFMDTESRRLLGRGVSVQAKAVATCVLNPPAFSMGPLSRWASFGVSRLVAAVIADLGPPELCRAYGVETDGLEMVSIRRAFAVGAGCSRLVTPRVPSGAWNPGTLVWVASRLASLAA